MARMNYIPMLRGSNPGDRLLISPEQDMEIRCHPEFVSAADPFVDVFGKDRGALVGVIRGRLLYRADANLEMVTCATCQGESPYFMQKCDYCGRPLPLPQQRKQQANKRQHEKQRHQ